MSNAEQIDCVLLSRLLNEDTFEGLKGAPLGFDLWRSPAVLPGFDRCRVREMPPQQALGFTYAATIECDTLQTDPESAAALARQTLEDLTAGCGRSGVPVTPNYGEAGFAALDMATGLALQSYAENQAMWVNRWRSELAPGLPETTIPPWRLVLQMLIPGAP